MRKPALDDDPFGFNQSHPHPATALPVESTAKGNVSGRAGGARKGSFNLYVDLVPSSAWYANLRKELSPDEWKACQKHAFKKAGYCCEICEEKGPKWPVECHERWEFDDKTGVQRLSALEALCPDCHEATHMGLAEVRGRQDYAIQKIIKVNGWPLEQVHAHIMQARDTYRSRSRRPWVLDLSLLTTLPIPLGEKTLLILRRNCLLAVAARAQASDSIDSLRESLRGFSGRSLGN